MCSPCVAPILITTGNGTAAPTPSCSNIVSSHNGCSWDIWKQTWVSVVGNYCRNPSYSCCTGCGFVLPLNKNTIWYSTKSQKGNKIFSPKISGSPSSKPPSLLFTARWGVFSRGAFFWTLEVYSQTKLDKALLYVGMGCEVWAAIFARCYWLSPIISTVWTRLLYTSMCVALVAVAASILAFQKCSPLNGEKIAHFLRSKWGVPRGFGGNHVFDGPKLEYPDIHQKRLQVPSVVGDNV